MQIIIDGYNLLKQGLKTRDISDKQRALFLKKLITYACAKNNQILVIFDGGSMTWPERYKIHALLTVVYVGKGNSADDALINYMQKYPQRPLVMVSSDLELQQAARAADVTVVQALDFWDLLVQENTPPAPKKKRSIAHKTSSGESTELDELMQTTVVPLKSVDTKAPLSRGKSRLSKIERATERVIKKL